MRRICGLVVALAVCAACAAPVPIPGQTPYDGRWDAWSEQYRAALVARCLRAGHVVVKTLPVRCLGPEGEYTP